MLDVTFDALDDYGTYQCSVENGAGLTGMADTMIEQGCKSSHNATVRLLSRIDHVLSWPRSIPHHTVQNGNWE